MEHTNIEQKKNTKAPNVLRSMFSCSRGFTLFELLVSISIFVIITSLALLNYKKYSSDLVVTNLAYDIALSVRKAQAYGINVQGFNSNYNVAYGISFTPSVSNKQYTLFADSNANGVYNEAGGEKVETFSILRGNKIEVLSKVSAENTEQCATSINITFLRPNPEAMIKVTPLPASFDHVKVYLISPEGRRKVVSLYPSGQISVQDPPATIPTCSGGGGR